VCTAWQILADFFKGGPDGLTKLTFFCQVRALCIRVCWTSADQHEC